MSTEVTGAEALAVKRTILVAVDNSDSIAQASERACAWAVSNLYRQGDELLFFHVIPVPMPQVAGGGMGGDFVFIDPDPQDDIRHVEDAKELISRRFVPQTAANGIPFKIEIVRFDTDNEAIGEVLCKRAQVVNAVAVVMASHNKGALMEFFLGSVTNYTSHHCKQPVLVMH